MCGRVGFAASTLPASDRPLPSAYPARLALRRGGQTGWATCNVIAGWRWVARPGGVWPTGWLSLQLQTAIQALVVGSCRREFWRFSFELWVIWAVCNCSASLSSQWRTEGLG